MFVAFSEAGGGVLNRPPPPPPPGKKISRNYSRTNNFARPAHNIHVFDTFWKLHHREFNLPCPPLLNPPVIPLFPSTFFHHPTKLWLLFSTLLVRNAALLFGRVTTKIQDAPIFHRTLHWNSFLCVMAALQNACQMLICSREDINVQLLKARVHFDKSYGATKDMAVLLGTKAAWVNAHLVFRAMAVATGGNALFTPMTFCRLKPQRTNPSTWAKFMRDCLKSDANRTFVVFYRWIIPDLYAKFVVVQNANDAAAQRRLKNNRKKPANHKWSRKKVPAPEFSGCHAVCLRFRGSDKSFFHDSAAASPEELTSEVIGRFGRRNGAKFGPHDCDIVKTYEIFPPRPKVHAKVKILARCSCVYDSHTFQPNEFFCASLCTS